MNLFVCEVDKNVAFTQPLEGMGAKYLLHTYSIDNSARHYTRPGYQAWVHTVVWFGQNCAPRPGSVQTNYRYCICCPGMVELVKSNLGTSFPLFHGTKPQHDRQVK